MVNHVKQDIRAALAHVPAGRNAWRVLFSDADLHRVEPDSKLSKPDLPSSRGCDGASAVATDHALDAVPRAVAESVAQAAV